MGSEQIIGGREQYFVERLVSIAGPIPKNHTEKVHELFRLRNAHVHLPLPP